MSCYPPKKLQAIIGEEVTNRWFFMGKPVGESEISARRISASLGNSLPIHNLQTLYVTLGGQIDSCQGEKFGGLNALI